MGTPRFLAYMTVFVVVWLGWNSVGPFSLRFDSREFGFTLLTLMLSLQASYSAPLILLAQNRQVDCDRVAAEQDRQGAERNLADTTRDFVRGELRDLLEELATERANGGDTDRAPDTEPSPLTP
jgi:uncharacterized membrane protein